MRRNQMNIALSDAERDRVTELERHYGLNRAHLIRMLVARAADEMRRAQGLAESEDER